LHEAAMAAAFWLRNSTNQLGVWPYLCVGVEQGWRWCGACASVDAPRRVVCFNTA
jgi:hypothetical protein